MDIASSVETPVRITTDRVKNPKRQEHKKKVNEKKKEIKLQMEKELESEAPEPWNYSVIPIVLVAIFRILYVHQKYASPTSSKPVKMKLFLMLKKQ